MAGFQVELRSREQILGDLIRSILANTDLNDVAVGSDLSLMLEAIATSQFQISLGALKILENSNLESLVGNALDKKAESLQLPNTIGGIGRIPAAQSSGIVTIGSSFTKLSTKFYAGKPAPFSGSKTLYLENAGGFDLAVNKKLYIGRGTADRFEGPIPYASATNMGSFWIIKLSSPLTKNHLYGDLVVLAQGGDRHISAGLIVHTTASNEVPAISFIVTSSSVLPDGESSIDTAIACNQFGETGNALAGSIREFGSLPFSGATVANASALKNGRSTESDEDLRKRIKNYPATLSRGTKAAIQAAIQGISDPDTGRTITSSVVVEPTETGDFSRVYIDDGSGLEPTFGVQPYELLLQSASGQETKFQTAQFPITPATAVGSESGPFVVAAGQNLTTTIDGIAETYTITASNYANLNAATAYEIVRDFNSQSNIVGFRTYGGGNQVVMTDLSGAAETLQVSLGDLQKIFGFPTSVIRPIFIYENSELKSFKGTTATLVTNAFSSWNPVPLDFYQVPVIVDGVTQVITITDSDFTQFQSDMASATISQWATVFSQKISGVSFEVAGSYLVWATRQTTSASGSLKIPTTKDDGSLVGWVGDAKMWKSATNGGILSSVGATKDFQLNRFTGEIKFINKPAIGSTIEIGSRSTRATLKSIITSTGLYGLSPFSSTTGNARLVLGFDGEFVVRSVSVSASDRFYPTVQDAVNAPNVIRLFSNNKYTFINAQVGDYIYLVKDATANPAWGLAVEGVYRVKSIGMNFASVNMNYSGASAVVVNGSNVVTVTIASHGFSSGAHVTITTSSAIGGISALDLSQPDTKITVTNSNQFTYVAGATGTGGVGIINQIVYLADSWVEFEVSQLQMIDWSPLLAAYQNTTVGMFNIFKSGGAIPQIVDFGAVGSVTIDSVINIINSQVACGQAVKISGKQFGIISNDWASGTVGVLAVIASASNIITTGTASSMQSHTAMSTSRYTQSGNPIAAIQDQTNIRPTSAAILMDKDNTDILSLGSEPTIASPSLVTSYPEGFENIWLTGRQAGLTGRLYNNQTTTPFTGILRTTSSIAPLETSDTVQTAGGNLNRYANYSIRLSDLSIAAEDRLVIQMDLDAINKTVAIPMFKKALVQDIDAITGSGKGQVISFRLKDPEDTYDDDGNPATPEIPRPFFHPESVYKDFDFRDFKLLTHNVGFYRETNTLALPAHGYMTPVHASAIDGVQDTDTFVISDGITTNIFEFDSNGSVTPGNIAVPFAVGSFATGSLTGGVDDAGALAILTSMVSAINGAGFNVLATAISTTRIALSNQLTGTAGNVPMTETIASGATLTPIGMVGGSDKTVTSNRALIVRSAAYGATSKTRITLLLPSEPNQASIIVSHLNNFENGIAQCNLLVTLASAATIAGSLLNSGLYSVSACPAGSLTLLTFTSPFLNPIGQYQPGNVMRVGGISTISGAYYVVAAAIGTVSVLAPCAGDISGLTVMSANQNPLSCYQLSNKTFVDVATAINAYLTANPVASGEAIGTNYSTNPILFPSYISNTSSTAYAGNVMTLGFIHHSFDCKLSGSAGIWQYDSSVPGLNGIKATIQTEDSIFPTTTEAAGTTYSPIGEAVVIVPTNSKTLASWMNFNATSSLIILAETLQVQSGQEIQIASRADGSLGGVKVTGVTANGISSFVIGNATDEGYSSKVKILSADAKSFMRGQLVKVANSVASEIMRPYRLLPTNLEITQSNTTDINTYFRNTNSVKYIKNSTNSARLIFYRFGQGPGQTEPLTVGTTITLSVPAGLTLADGIIQVASSAGNLAARTGDMMYVTPSSPFPADVQCKGLDVTGITDPSYPEYWGYPVVKVIDPATILILAPNITSLGSTVTTSTTDLVFLPAVYNEKNIRSNKKEGAKFTVDHNSGYFYFLIKSLGGNLVSLWLQNSATEATDTMRLKELQVNTDNNLTLGTGFDSANQGTFQIIGHNGRNHIVFYNPNGGKDEIFDSTSLIGGGIGQRIWRVGPVTGTTRSIRVVDSESIKIGDLLRISTPVTSSPWFSSSFIGSWRVTGMGYIGITQSSGRLTPVAADPLVGIADGDTFTLGDGSVTKVFEFDTNATLVNSNHIRVSIQPASNAADVANAIASAINGLGIDFGITAIYQSGFVYLLNRHIDKTSNFTIVESFVHGVTLSPVNMSGAGVSNGALTPYIDIYFPNAVSDLYSSVTGLPVDKFLIAGNDSAIGFVEATAFSGFRIVGGHDVNAQNVEDSDLFLTPKIQTSKMSETFGTQINGLFKIGFEERTFQGIDGYKVFAGLVREAHRVIDGLPTNTILYPGTKAMGAAVEVEPPLVKTIQMSLSVRPKDGVTINSISEIIKSTVAGYINKLGVGKPVVISEIIRIVQGLPGVYSVTVTSTTPVVTDDRIVISDIESASVHNVDSDISVG